MLSSIMASVKSGFSSIWVVAGKVGCLQSTNMHSWVTVQEAVLEHVFAAGLVCSYGGFLSSSSLEMMC